VVAGRLGVSISGLARGGVTEALTTEQIDALKAEQPEWLRAERAIHAEVRREAVRVKEKHAKEQRSEERKPAEAHPAPARRTFGGRGGQGR
jgi:hypothetical protein